MANVGYATLQIIPSAKGFVPALNAQVAPGMAAAGAASGAKFSGGFMGSMKTMAGPLAAMFAGTAVLGFLKSAITEGSNLAETVSKANVIFGSGAEAVNKWSENSAKAMGMSQQLAIDSASSFAVFGKSAGMTGDALSGFATKLGGLSSDMASFSNTSPEEAATAISAALRGESEPIRRYGVLLNEAGNKAMALKLGLISTTAEALTPANRVLAVNAQIWAQTTDAQGDFARTAGGVANKTRTVSAEMTNLKAKIGTGLQPVVKTFLGFLAGLISLIGKIPGPVAVFVAVFATVITAFVLGKTAITLFNLGFKALNTLVRTNYIVIAIALIVAGLIMLYTKSDTFRKIVNENFIKVAKVVGAVVGGILTYISAFIKMYTLAITTVLNLLARIPVIGDKFKSASDAVNKMSTGITSSLDKMANGASASFGKFATDLVKVPTAAENAAAAAKKVAAEKLAAATAASKAAAAEKAKVASVASAEGKKLAATALKALPSAIGASFIKGVQGSTDTIKTTFTKLAAIVKDIGNKTLVAAVAETQKKILALATSRDALSETYKSAKESLSSLKDEAKSYLRSVSDAVVASGNIANGRNFTNMVRTLTMSVAKAKEFNNVIAGLKGAGLNNTSLSQLVEAGPAAGLKAAKALLASGTGGVAIINDLNSQLKAQGDSIGKTITGSIFDAATLEAEAAVKKIGDDLTTMETQIVSVAAALAKEIAKISKIAAPIWLADLIAQTSYTVPKSVGVTNLPKTGTTSSNGVTGNRSATNVVVNTYNPISEPTSVTISRTMTKLAMIGAYDK